MPIPRFRVRTLMNAVIALAIGLAALRNASQLWVNIAFNLTVVALIYSTYRARCSRGVQGAWWTGFATFGWVHLTLGLIGTGLGQMYGVQPTLATSYVAAVVVDSIEPDNSVTMLTKKAGMYLVAHCGLSLLLSLLGAQLFGLFARRRLDPDEDVCRPWLPVPPDPPRP